MSAASWILLIRTDQVIRSPEIVKSLKTIVLNKIICDGLLCTKNNVIILDIKNYKSIFIVVIFSMFGSKFIFGINEHLFKNLLFVLVYKISALFNLILIKKKHVLYEY